MFLKVNSGLELWVNFLLFYYTMYRGFYTERRDEKYGMKNGTREWKEGDKMNKHINYWGKEKGE